MRIGNRLSRREVCPTHRALSEDTEQLLLWLRRGRIKARDEYVEPILVSHDLLLILEPVVARERQVHEVATARRRKRARRESRRAVVSEQNMEHSQSARWPHTDRTASGDGA